MSGNDLITLLQTMPEGHRDRDIVFTVLTEHGEEVQGEVGLINTFAEYIELADHKVMLERTAVAKHKQQTGTTLAEEERRALIEERDKISERLRNAENRRANMREGLDKAREANDQLRATLRDVTEDLEGYIKHYGANGHAAWHAKKARELLGNP